MVSMTGITFNNTSLYVGVGTPTASLVKDSTIDGGVITHFMEAAATFGLRNNIAKVTLKNFRMISDNNFAVQFFEFRNLANPVFENVEFVWFPDRFRNSNHQSNTCVIFNDISNADIKNISILGGQLQMTSVKDSIIDGLSFGNTANGQTVATYLSYGVRVFGCTNVTIRDFKAYGGIENLQPVTAMFEANTTNGPSNKITIRDIGTRDAPYGMGSGAARCTIFTSLVGTDIKIMRVNLANGGDVTINGTQTPINGYNFLTQDVTISAGQTAGQNTALSIRRGVRALSPTSYATHNYGVHFDDTFSTDTQGRITLLCNDSVPQTANQFEVSTGARGTTGAGGLYLINVGDTATWTLPYYSLGHTGIAKMTGGASATETWRVDSTSPYNLEATYQIDTGAGFGSAKWLFSIGRQSSGGNAGTNTVTINSTDWNAMTRKPAIGDYLQGTNANVPAGTTITNVSGQQLTLSNTITQTFSGSIYFWNDISNETISASAGFKIKVILRCNQASNLAIINQIRIPTDTTLASQTNNPYPIPTLTVSNLVANSRIKVTRVDTGAVLANKTNGSNTSIDIELTYAGLVQIEVRNASGSPAYKPFVTRTTVNLSTVTTVVALQEVD
jgi:hypothetical protein